ncbi:MAG: DUF1015 family protein [Flavobacteriaceae bacterium]
MTLLKAFKGWVSAAKSSEKVPIKHIDTYSKEDIESVLTSNEQSFFKVLEPSLFGCDQIDLQERFALVRERLLEQLSTATYQRFNINSLWIYRVSSTHHSATGVVGVTPIEAYIKRRIKRHEETQSSRRNNLSLYLEEVGIHADPVVLSFENQQQEFQSLVEEYARKTKPTIALNIHHERHELWQLSDPSITDQISTLINANHTLYLIDGHHRIESVLHYSQRQQTASIDAPPAHFLSFLIPENELNIKAPVDTYTLSLSTEECTKLLQHHLSLTKAVKVDESTDQILFAETPYNFRLQSSSSLPDLKAYLKTLMDHKRPDTSETTLTLRPKKYTVKELKRAADFNEPLTPKSTYIEPKLLTGLILYPIT